MDKIRELKKERLRDIIRRTIANPSNLEKVVDRLAVDWNPMLKINPDGSMEIEIGANEPSEHQP